MWGELRLTRKFAKKGVGFYIQRYCTCKGLSSCSIANVIVTLEVPLVVLPAKVMAMLTRDYEIRFDIGLGTATSQLQSEITTLNACEYVVSNIFDGIDFFI